MDGFTSGAWENSIILQLLLSGFISNQIIAVIDFLPLENSSSKCQNKPDKNANKRLWFYKYSLPQELENIVSCYMMYLVTNANTYFNSSSDHETGCYGGIS